MKTWLIVIVWLISLALAQDYDGIYVQQDDPSTVITLQTQNEGYVGTLLNSGTDEFGIEAFVQNGYLTGYLRGESIGFNDLFFLAELSPDGLNLVVAPVDEQGNPIESEAKAYSFVRQGVSTEAQQPLASKMPTATTTNPLAQPNGSDVFAGDYQGQAFNLSLEASATGYSGFILMQGQTYPVTAQATASTLTGNFLANGQTFSFQAVLSGTTLSLISDGQTYTLSKIATSANPLAHTPQNPLGSSPDSPSPILAKGRYADLTEDNALAVFEAYAFSLQQLGYTETLGEAQRQEFMTYAAQEYPYADQETQLTLARAREVWTQVQANWQNASLEEKRGFVLAIISLVHGEEAVQQNLGQNATGSGSDSGGDYSSLGCSSVYSCMQTLDPEGYQDMVNAQNCWAGAGCSSYDSETNTFYEEPDYYETPSYDYGD